MPEILSATEQSHEDPNLDRVVGQPTLRCDGILVNVFGGCRGFLVGAQNPSVPSRVKKDHGRRSNRRGKDTRYTPFVARW